MSELINILLVVGFLFASVKVSQKMKAMRNELAKMTQIAGTVTSADEYLELKRTEAENIQSLAQQETEKMQSFAQKNIDLINEKLSILSKKRVDLLVELDALRLHVVYGMVKVDAYENMRSDEIKNELSMLAGQQDILVKDEAATKITDLTIQKKIINNRIKQILRCFNAECANILGNVTVKNIDASRAKIQRSFEAVNKIFAPDCIQISQSYLALKFKELSLIYAYMVKKDEETDQRRAIKEQMVEEEKVRREIEREKQKIEKEEAQFTNEISKLMAYMQKSRDDVERNLYIHKMNELEEKLNALAADKENVLQREHNTRAGFVYIISNVGAFGENIFKIGMTRRLEPMDRIAELSSASVPFPFDVHAMIFSEDAPSLESVLHRNFDTNRVNLANQRKEFFSIDLEQIKDVVLKNHNATVRFVDIPDAVEYRETLRKSTGIS